MPRVIKMPTPIPPEEYPALQQLVNGTYLDKLEQIDAAQVEDDNDTITLVGRDGVKRLACKISSSGIQYRLLNPEAIKGDAPSQAAFSLSDGGGDLTFAAAVASPDTPAQLTDRVSRAGNRIIADWLELIQEAIFASGDLGQVGDKLLELYPKIPAGDLAKLLEQASTVAGMAGYYEASEREQG